MTGSSPPFAGVPFGRYVIRRRLARGGMGEVFLADQLGPLGPLRPVALKRMLPRVARDPRAAKMFLEEMATAAQLNHPNVATTYDFGEVDGVYFLAMEYVDGLSLRQIVESMGPLPVADALGIAAEVASALEHAHNRRTPGGGVEPVVHRDVSPHNIMISASGAVKLLDFGIARAEAAVLGGRVEGKLAYAAPEQLEGAPAERRSDLWALGVVLYEMLSGVVPFAGADASAMRDAMVAGQRVPLATRRPEAANVAPIIDRALLDDPDARWSTAQEFGAACRALASELQARGAEGRAQLVVRAGGPREVDLTIGARGNAAVDMSTGMGVGLASSVPIAPAPTSATEPVRTLLIAPDTPATPRDAGTAPQRPRTKTAVDERTPALATVPLAGAPPSTLPYDESTVPLLDPPRTRARPVALGFGASLILLLGGAAYLAQQSDPARPPPATERALPSIAAVAASTTSVDSSSIAALRHDARAVVAPSDLTQAVPTHVGAQPEDGARPETNQRPEATRRPEVSKRPRRTPRSSARAAARERRAKDAAASEAPAGLGLLSVRTVPWSRVSVDGRELGPSPLVLAPTSAGPHTLVLEPGQGPGQARTLTVHIRTGEVTKVFVDFARDTARVEP